MFSYCDLIGRLSSRYDSGEARAIVRLFLEAGFGLSWTDVLCGALNTLDDEKKEAVENIMQRLMQGEPVQYVLGEAEFYGRMFNVAEGVLIPRVETEELVSKILSVIESAGVPMPPRILDIGVGSGCIGITLALEMARRCADYEVYGVDVSSKALDIAASNVAKLGAGNIRLIEADILDLKQQERIPCDLSVVVSNPPYILYKEKKDMESHVLDYEPSLALFVPDEDPLLFYRAISRFATTHLGKGGRLFFEINRAYGEAVRDLLVSDGYTDVEVMKDQFGNDRMVMAVKAW